jgi:hypothetical protein
LHSRYSGGFAPVVLTDGKPASDNRIVGDDCIVGDDRIGICRNATRILHATLAECRIGG